MPANPISAVDPDGLLEFSVVFTDRSLNHMSAAFQVVMRDISATLKKVYGAHAVAVVPGGGTYGMESVARQLATGKRVTVIRNGFFSYRWTQIFEMGGIPAAATVLQARRTSDAANAPWVPAPIEEVEAHIRSDKPDLVFAPHVETASGILLPDDYLRRVAAAVHAVGGLFVLDCIASGHAVGEHAGARRRRADHGAAERLVRHAGRGPRDAERERSRSASQRRRARASRWISASGCRSWRPTKAAATRITPRCRPTACAACAI